MDFVTITRNLPSPECCDPERWHVTYPEKMCVLMCVLIRYTAALPIIILLLGHLPECACPVVSHVLICCVLKVRGAERWLCYMCCPENSQVGLLSKREDWDVYLRELFMNDHEMEYVSSLSLLFREVCCCIRIMYKSEVCFNASPRN